LAWVGILAAAQVVDVSAARNCIQANASRDGNPRDVVRVAHRWSQPQGLPRLVPGTAGLASERGAMAGVLISEVPAPFMHAYTQATSMGIRRGKLIRAAIPRASYKNTRSDTTH
jgi:hypothetical protein